MEKPQDQKDEKYHEANGKPHEPNEHHHETNENHESEEQEKDQDEDLKKSQLAHSNTIDIDRIITELGQGKWHQIKIFGLILVPIMVGALYNSQYIFAAGTTNHRCVVPPCESSPPSFVPGAWADWALDNDRCRRREPLLNDTCSADAFHLNNTIPCDDWLYEDDYTIVSEFGLACREWKRTMVGTIHSAGMFAALPLTGFVSDTFGRRTALLATAVAAGLMGLIRSFSPNYVMYVTFEFLDATLGSGVYSTGFILALEMISQERRVLGGNIISSSYAIGQVFMALIAWGVPYWRSLTRVIYAPSLLFIFYYFLIEESVRWLLSKGKKKEAAKIIFKIAAVNNTKLSSLSIRQLTDDVSSIEVHKENEVQKGLFTQVIKSKVLMLRVVICSFWWMTVVFIYYGLSINSVTLAGNMYLNYILTSLVEVPGYALSVLTLDRFGRKRSIMTAFVVCGLSLVAFPFVPKDLVWLSTSLTLLGKLSISMSFSSIYIYTSELFPTGARHRLLATCSMIGRIGNIIAPQTPLLMKYMVSLPYLLFGGMAILASLLMSLTPETLNMHLPDTVEQAEKQVPITKDLSS